MSSIHPTIGTMSLHGAGGGRKYLNACERKRFADAAQKAPTRERLFCLTLAFTGARISEVLALTPSSFDTESSIVALHTLKRRRVSIIRQVPLPPWLVDELDNEFKMRSSQRAPEVANSRLWTWSRSTAWRRVKAVMAAADMHGLAATPKGLRHTFGVASFEAKVPPHLVQRWLGHASLRTTAIYGDVSGEEERIFSVALWQSW